MVNEIITKLQLWWFKSFWLTLRALVAVVAEEVVVFPQDWHITAAAEEDLVGGWICNCADVVSLLRQDDCSSSCFSLFNLLFSSLKLSQCFLKNSHSFSVCFNFVLKTSRHYRKSSTQNTRKLCNWSISYCNNKDNPTLLSCSETILPLVLVLDSISQPAPVSGPISLVSSIHFRS